MGLRTPIRWGFSGLTALAGVVIGANVQKLLEARGWDTFLTTGHIPDAGRWAFLIGPWMLLGAIIVAVFTAGLWVDAWLARLDGRPRDTGVRKLGQDAINLAYALKNARESYFRQDATALLALIYATMIRFQKAGFDTPSVPEDASANQKFWVAEKYFFNVGTLLRAGHIAHAKDLARDRIPLPDAESVDSHRF